MGGLFDGPTFWQAFCHNYMLEFEVIRFSACRDTQAVWLAKLIWQPMMRWVIGLFG